MLLEPPANESPILASEPMVLSCLNSKQGALALMNIHQNLYELDHALRTDKPSVLRQILRFFVEVLSSPKGNQGGWEGGARGL